MMCKNLLSKWGKILSESEKRILRTCIVCSNRKDSRNIKRNQSYFSCVNVRVHEHRVWKVESCGIITTIIIVIVADEYRLYGFRFFSIIFSEFVCVHLLVAAVFLYTNCCICPELYFQITTISFSLSLHHQHVFFLSIYSFVAL